MVDNVRIVYGNAHVASYVGLIHRNIHMVDNVRIVYGNARVLYRTNI